MLNEDLSHEVIAVDIEDAIRMNADCMAIQTFIGADGQLSSLDNLSRTINAGLRYSVPVMGVVAVGKQMERTDRFFKLATRILAELGANIIKTYYCENFEEIVAACPVPIVVAGGKKVSEPEALQLAYNSIQGGAKGVDMETVCLHVGAGTFLPVKSSEISGHTMHREPFVVRRAFIEDLRRGGRPVIAVGTTSVRTLESLYYVGVKCIENGQPEDIGQWMPYEKDYSYSLEESLDAVLEYLDSKSLDELKVGTRIIIVPGYRFRVVDILVTNFHQPKSTLLLLISAFVDGDWRKIYDYALSHDFRFLSYGDSSVLFRNKD